MEVPVFLFTGFLDSGKSTFINDTLQDEEFATGEKTILILCEEGEIEYDEKALEKSNTYIVRVEKEEDLTSEFLKECNAQYRPRRVIVEFNGMWRQKNFMETQLPRKWVMGQILCTIDSTTFNMYINNMKSLVMEQVTYADLIIINRCTEETDQTMFRRNIKAVNRMAQIIYETVDGHVLSPAEEQLPFDLSGEEVEICDEDFGIWYLDAMDHPEKYAGKKIRFRAIVYKNREIPKGCFVAGRFAMTCCADDIAFIGMLAHYEFADRLQIKEWVNVTARVKGEYHPLYQGEGAVLYVEDIGRAEKPEEDLVYFN